MKSVLLVCGALFIVYAFGGILGGVTAFALKPWYSVTSWISDGQGNLPTYLRDRDTLHQEITRLTEDLANSQLNGGRSAFLESENSELRALLGGADDTQSDRITSGIIGRPPHTPYDTLFLDRGSDDGIIEGTPVYYFGDHLIGFIGNVYERSSVVMLLSSPDFETTVYVFGPDIYTTARGVGDGVLRVSVPQDILLSEGDMVVAPTLTKGIIGRIGVIQSETTKPEQFGFVLPPVSLQSMRLVSVGRDIVSNVSFETAQVNVSTLRTGLFTIPVPEDILVDEITSSTTPSVPDDVE